MLYVYTKAIPKRTLPSWYKGQRWGVRRFQNPDGSLTPAGRKRYLKQGRKLQTEADEEGGKMKGAEVLALWLGIIVALDAVPFAVNAGVSAAKKASANKFVAKCDKERDDAPIEKSTGLKKKATELPEKEDIKRVNPQFNVDRYDADSTGATSNCVNCTMALEMRKRGYEVQAKIRTSGRDGFAEGKKYFNAKTVTVQKEPKRTKDDMDEWTRFFNREERKARRQANKDLADKTIESIKSASPVGARGQICVLWNRHSGHSMMYDVTEKGVRLLDGQTGKIYDEKAANKLLRSCCTAEYQRFDNCKVNYKDIKEAVR